MKVYSSKGFVKSMLMISIIASSANAVADEKVLKLKPSDKQERNNPQALVSGSGWLAGLAFMGRKTAERPSMYADVPKGWRGKRVCLRSIMQSGQYFGHIEYEIKETFEGGRVKFEYDGVHADTLKKMDPVNAGFVLQKSTCKRPTDKVVPIYSNIQPIESGAKINRTLRVNINAQRADQMALRAVIGKADLPVACNRLRGEGRVSFNHFCTIEIPAGTTGKVKIGFWRWRNGNPARPRFVDLELH